MKRDKSELERQWDEAVTAFLLTPPTDPSAPTLYVRVRELDAKCRAAGVLPPLR